MTVIAAIALILWAYLLLAHGRFWQAGPMLAPEQPMAGPPVAAVIPARDEAATIEAALRSLLTQDYLGPLRIILVDDGSTDRTSEIAQAIGDARLTVLSGTERPPGWSGKLWAVAQGLAEAESDAALILLTDADIIHDPRHLSTLVAQSERERLDLVSEMVTLPCSSLAERVLIPAFVFFFQLLYPFARVNDPLDAAAAAAGGTILVRTNALKRIGGIEAVRGALIDDVALAGAVKRGGRIWLGHGSLALSIRRYPHAADIWRMVTRTAYVQLDYSPLRLLLCLLGLALVFLVPPLATIDGEGATRAMGAASWAVLAWSYLPTLRRFGRSPLWAPLLPLVALFYMAATLGSALNHHFGRGVAWKGRAYGGAGA